MTPVVAGNPMDMALVSTGNRLIAMAAAAGIPNGQLYVEMNNGGQYLAIPKSQWQSAGVPQGDGQLFLLVAFGTQPTSEAWGNYHSVGEMMWALQNPQITGITSIKQLVPEVTS
jgi:hypothetical protein